MDFKNTLLCLSLLLVGSHRLAPDDRSARRYGSFLENDYDTDIFILTNKEAVDYLEITDAQRWGIVSILEMNFIKCNKIYDKLDLLVHSKEFKKMTKTEASDRYNEIFDKMRKCNHLARKAKLKFVLNGRQMGLLNGLQFQYRGPTSLFKDPSIKKDFLITKEQEDRFAEIKYWFKQNIRQPKEIYMQLQCWPLEPWEPAWIRWWRIAAAYESVRAIEIEMDEATMDLLDDFQKKKWKCACGDLVPIEWGPKLLNPNWHNTTELDLYGPVMKKQPDR